VEQVLQKYLPERAVQTCFELIKSNGVHLKIVNHRVLKTFDKEERKNTYVFELPHGSTFRIYNGKIFKKGNKRVKRFECIELNTGRLFLFQPNAEVELID